MFWFSKNHTYPIGVDMGNDTVRLVQLGSNGNSVSLIAVGSEQCPEGIEAGSSAWQRWAIDAIRELTANGKFRGKDIAAAMPAGEVFIDHIKMPRTNDGKAEESLFAKIKQKLPFESDNAIMKYIPTEDNNVMVIATERKKIDRHLAIYERSGLQIKFISVWPVAMTNIYTRFFGRRRSDLEAIVMLLNIETNFTNVVICRHKNLLFARSIPVGTNQLDTEEMITRLVLELTGCRRLLGSMYKKTQIERLIFLSGQAVDEKVCTMIAKQLEMPAQMGDCLAAIESGNFYELGIDRRNCRVDWATAFGLSLS